MVDRPRIVETVDRGNHKYGRHFNIILRLPGVMAMWRFISMPPINFAARDQDAAAGVTSRRFYSLIDPVDLHICSASVVL